ncbi:hypothetical protein C0J52_07579 [Blattella germanica]|nr:hypothetical protein C0J52_07579 [Blattella germanica]
MNYILSKAEDVIHSPRGSCILEDLEQPPAKYNSKLMNSIWGLYNRYSVHNLKKVTEGEDAFAGVQQSSAADTPTSTSSSAHGGSPHNSSQCISAWDAFWIGLVY